MISQGGQEGPGKRLDLWPESPHEFIDANDLPSPQEGI
jgi:hypothetical protein